MEHALLDAQTLHIIMKITEARLVLLLRHLAGVLVQTVEEVQ